MTNDIECDVWLRGTLHASTHVIPGVPAQAGEWTDDDVRRLLSGMLLALDHEKNPGGGTPAVTLRGFSWIVSLDESGGVLVHVEMQMGTASAGPIHVDAQRLTTAIERVMKSATPPDRVH